MNGCFAKLQDGDNKLFCGWNILIGIKEKYKDFHVVCLVSHCVTINSYDIQR